VTDNLQSIRRFRVRTLHADDHHGYVVSETSFEAAAIAYLERHPAVAGPKSDVGILVCELDSGHEHCFRVDLETGETVPCG
jgi:hypothetical protein